MAFSDILSDSQNQIRVQPPVQSGGGIAAGINAAAGLVGSFVSEVKDKEDAAFRDKLMSDLQKEFLTTTEAYKQGVITQQELNLKMDARLRQVRADNPWRADDIDKWVKEDLGIQPRTNTIATEIQQAKQQAEVQEAIFNKATEMGIVAYDNDGKIDRNTTIRRFQDVQLAQLQLSFAAKQGEANTAEARKSREIELNERSREFYNRTMAPAVRTIYESVSKNPDIVTDADKLRAAREIAVQKRAELVFQLNQATQGTFLDPEAIKRNIEEQVSRFDQEINTIFAIEEGAENWALAGKRIRALQSAQDKYGTQAGEVLAPVQDYIEILGPNAKDAVLSDLILGTTSPTVGRSPALKPFQTTINGLVDVANQARTIADVGGGNVRPSDVPLRSRVEAAPMMNTMVDKLAKAPTLNDKDLANLTRSITALGLTANDPKVDPKSRTNFIKRMSQPDVFNKLNASLNKPETAEDTREALSVIRQNSKAEIEGSIIELMGADRALVGSVFNPDTGKMEQTQKPDGERGVLNRLAFPLQTKGQAAKLQGIEGKAATERFNRALDAYSKSVGLLSNRDPNVIKQEVIKARGLPTKRPLSIGTSSEDVSADVAPTQPAAPKIRKRFVDGKLVDIVE